MPVRTVHICSFCKADIQDGVSSYVLSGYGVKLGFDVCQSCTEGGVFAKVFAAGENRRRGPRAAVIAPAHSNGKVGPKKAGKAEAKTSCPDCDYTNPRPQTVGLHRRKEHGYVSAQRRVKV